MDTHLTKEQPIVVKTLIYPNAVVTRLHNRRIAVIDCETGGAEIMFHIVDGTNDNRVQTGKLRNKGSVTAFKLTPEGVEALHHTLSEWLKKTLANNAHQ